MRRLRRMLDSGAIRRIGAVPNHYALGFRANGMSVWDVDDDRVDELGARVGALRFVSHCYRRPRVPPVWRYNLFAMVHGRDREEAAEKSRRSRRCWATPAGRTRCCTARASSRRPACGSSDDGWVSDVPHLAIHERGRRPDAAGAAAAAVRARW